MQTQERDTAAAILDAEQFGRLLRAARIVAGFDRVRDAAAAIRNTSGVAITERALYALERGEQRVTVEQLLGVVVTYRPIGGGAFFAGAVRRDAFAALRPEMVL